MIQIDRIDIREIRLPLKTPFQTAAGVVRERRILLLEVRDAGGLVAWSECVAGEWPNYTEESIDTAWLALQKWIAPAVLGPRFDGPELVKPFLDRRLRGHNMAKAAVEMACWALDAQQKGLSLARRLGGGRETVATGIAIGMQPSPAAWLAQVAEALQQGYRRIKIKIKPGADVAVLQLLREHFGAALPLMVDANCAYTGTDFASLRQLDAFDLLMLEQPLAWNDLLQHAALQKQLRTSICLDESIPDLHAARAMVALGSGKIVNLKPGRVGGFAEAIAIHDFCAESQVPVWCGGMLESGIGRAYNVALAALDNFTLPGDLSPSARYWQQDVVYPEWTMDSNGMVQVPDRPGLGVEIDTGRIEKLTQEKVTMLSS